MERAKAKNNAMPMAPPYSAPRTRDMRKYAPPPFTGMFVLIAEMEREVVKVIDFAIINMITAPTRPAWPTTKLARMNMITPKIVRIAGVKTPAKVLN